MIAAATIGTGIALAALNVALFAWLRNGLNRLEDRFLAVEKEQARTTGFLEGLGLFGRAMPTPDAG